MLTEERIRKIRYPEGDGGGHSYFTVYSQTPDSMVPLPRVEITKAESTPNLDRVKGAASEEAYVPWSPAEGP